MAPKTGPGNSDGQSPNSLWEFSVGCKWRPICCTWGRIIHLAFKEVSHPHEASEDPRGIFPVFLPGHSIPDPA